MPLFSVVIPVYNAALTLPATIAALQAQTVTDWECILVEDASTDDSWQVADALVRTDRRLTLVRNPGKGPSAARNHGALTLARGEIIAFCDADDLWQPRKLQGVSLRILDRGADAAFGRIGFFRDTPEDVRTRSTLPMRPVTVPMLLGENPVCTLSNLSLRRSVFAALGGFREDIVHNEDLEFLIRLAGNGHRIEGIESDHVLYRLSPHGLSANLDAMRAGRAEALRTAAELGYRPDPRAEAIHLRYLARRALRLGAPARMVRRLVIEGCREDARAFLLPARRGALIACAALTLPILPRALRRKLFSN
ncbi:glycosyltransferase family 2 protein [Rhodalgimonas zhirmunskyi]|uniref:Glycosyltransferase n=1 Tax=Rhodalgimonas zhirmunskyi TaxID=2964767 RepID=A0AAJ1UCE2_9RHOB|nr:glycosyltransferase family 2 protein [Rhodoalgimonas zhirmunskyi]MDQ2094938.1 glycosyltransferase [Rhodoalgimonas zhirmunskyi]